MIKLKEYINLPKADRQLHLDLNSECLLRGGNSTNHRGVLAQFLNTEIASPKIVLAHACNNPKCSNPVHLYWASYYENIVEDGKKYGSHKNIWERTVEKYGLEKALEIQRKGDKAKGGLANKGKPKSLEHRKKISESIKNKRANSPKAGDN